MTPARFQTIEEIFYTALDCNPEQIEAFLEKACTGDESMRFQIKTLLASHQQVGDFIQDPVVELATRILDAEETDASRRPNHWPLSARRANRRGRDG